MELDIITNRLALPFRVLVKVYYFTKFLFTYYYLVLQIIYGYISHATQTWTRTAVPKSTTQGSSVEYKYSIEVEPSTYETEGLCDGIPLRRHIASDLEEIGTYKAQIDWRKHVGPLGRYKGGLGPNYSFMTVSVPECLPDRLEIISYANEFAFLHDDITDFASKAEGDAANNEMLEAFKEGAKTGKIAYKSSGKRQMQAKVLREMISIDRERAIVAMKSWATFVELASGRKHHEHYASLDEYLPYRCIDVGHMFWHGLVTFGCGLSIPEEEADLCKELMIPALIAASLTNDLFSYTKEYEDTMRAGHKDVVNAIWVLMGEHDISEAEAKLMCRERIKLEIRKYVQTVKDVNLRTDISDDLKKYIELMQYSLSGNVVWSLQCPRYNESAQYNELQLLRQEFGIDKYPAQWPPKGETHSATSINQYTLHNTAPAGSRSYSAGAETNGLKKRTVTTIGTKSNGLTSNSTRTNGVIPNGATTKGIQTNGIKTNGIKANGVKTNGVNTNGFKPNGVTTSEAIIKTTSAEHTGSASLYTNNYSTVPTAQPLSMEQALKITINKDLPELTNDLVMAPYVYLASLPSKGVRDQAFDAINLWLKCPPESGEIIKQIVKMLHGASLMLDDLQDQSPLRRGKPSTHVIYGDATTINSATYQFMQAVSQLQGFSNPATRSIFLEEMEHLFVGQSFDIHWTSNLVCPTVPEYLKMVDGKTGALFRMITRLMAAEAGAESDVDMSTLSCLFGRYFQIRDDYQNLKSQEYTKQKGFCEDLDEGKYSLPLILALQSQPNNLQLQGMLLQRRVNGKSTLEQKKLILGFMEEAKSLEHTHGILVALQEALEAEITRLEGVFGIENFQLRLLLDLLRV